MRRSGRGLADEVDLQTRDCVEESIRERSPSDVEAAVRPVNQDQVGDATLAHDLLEPASKVGGFSPDDLRAQVHRVVQVGLDVLLPVA
jgi:imidazolonepropionase-like amidohydrolase